MSVVESRGGLDIKQLDFFFIRDKGDGFGQKNKKGSYKFIQNKKDPIGA